MLQTPRPRTLLFSAAALVTLGFAALAVDLPVANWCIDPQLPRELLKLISLSEAFAHGLGAAVILIAVVLLDPIGKRALPRLATLSLGSGLVVNALKLTIARMRPHTLDGQDEVLATFLGWTVQVGRSSAWQSWPSGHTAVAVGLALGLSWRYRRARWLFAVLAVLAMSQRVLARDHFVSDTAFGAAVAFAVAAGCVAPAWLGKRFDRLEVGPGAEKEPDLR